MWSFEQQFLNIFTHCHIKVIDLKTVNSWRHSNDVHRFFNYFFFLAWFLIIVEMLNHLSYLVLSSDKLVGKFHCMVHWWCVEVGLDTCQNISQILCSRRMVMIIFCRCQDRTDIWDLGYTCSAFSAITVWFHSTVLLPADMHRIMGVCVLCPVTVAVSWDFHKPKYFRKY